MKFKGLTNNEVIESRDKYGTNKLSELKQETFFSKMKDNLQDPMIKILIIALCIKLIFSFMGKSNWIETFGIFVAIIATTFISTFSEYKNENTFQKLQEDASRILVKVYRNNVICEIPIDDLVVGDIIQLQTGDKIPADGILRDGSIDVDQSMLNGESKECKKYSTNLPYQNNKIDFLDKHNLFRGSVVVSGTGIMEITVVGDKSVFGKIASELQTDVERDSPLKLKLSQLADKISKFGYCGAILIAVAYLFQQIVVHNNFDIINILNYSKNYFNIFNDIIQALMFAVIIVVMAVPEGLPLMIAIVSSQKMSSMLKDNILVKTISGIETSGSLNIIFSDKTGTITKGKLEVINFITGDNIERKKFSDIVVDKLRHILYLDIIMNTDAKLSNGKEIIGGNMTEKALIKFIQPNYYECKDKKLNSLPFNSSDKYSSCCVEHNNNKYVLFKGMPEKIIDKCTYCIDEYGNKHNIDKEKLYSKINELSKKAIRVLVFGYSEVNNDYSLKLDDNDIIFIGLVGIRDDVRPEAVEAIKDCQSSGIQVVMVTGDKKETAIAIAKEANLITSNDNIALTDDELNSMSDIELQNILPKLRVVARALPSTKSRLVKIAQDLNLVVAMTGK